MYVNIIFTYYLWIFYRAATATKGVSTAEEKLRKLTVEENEFSTRRLSLEKETRVAASVMEQATHDITRLKQEEVDIQARIRSGIASVEEAKASIQQGSSGPSGVIANLVKASKKGGKLASAGVRGRLGDLGTIAAEYDLAISLGCSMLDSVVVDSAAGTQQCLRYLKETGQGRVTFIILEELADFRAKMDVAPVGIPSGARRLFDLITPVDPIFRPAFYLSLRDTLVTSDLDSAVRMAYDGAKVKWRVVTLDGTHSN